MKMVEIMSKITKSRSLQIKIIIRGRNPKR